MALDFRADEADVADGGQGGQAGLHLIKLCVGADGVADLAAWQARAEAQADPRAGDRRPVHVTRMWPRRAAELLAGGSLYWVIRGMIAVRQRIAGLEPRTGADGVRRCAILLDPELVAVAARPRKPFQGWRYLAPGDAPPDLGGGVQGGAGLPAELEQSLGALGLVERRR